MGWKKKGNCRTYKTLPDIEENLILTYNEVKEFDIDGDGVHITVMTVWKWLLS